MLKQANRLQFTVLQFIFPVIDYRTGYQFLPPCLHALCSVTVLILALRSWSFSLSPEAGLDHVTCFGQWANSKHGASRELGHAGAQGPFLPPARNASAPTGKTLIQPPGG